LVSLFALAVAVLHKDRHTLVLNDHASNETSNATETASEPAEAANATASNATASNETTEADAAAGPAPDTALRCELLLDKSLEDIHKNGGIEAFANAAASELAQAAEVNASCVHILNLRGKYDHGMDALNLMQLVKRFLRRGATKVVVDFEILPECKSSYGTVVEKVQKKLENNSSALRTGWLHMFLDSHSKVVKAHGASDSAMEATTMTTKPAEESTGAAAAALLLAFFAVQA